MSKYTCCDIAHDNEALVDRFDISVTHCPWCCVELPGCTGDAAAPQVDERLIAKSVLDALPERAMLAGVRGVDGLRRLVEDQVVEAIQQDRTARAGTR